MSTQQIPPWEPLPYESASEIVLAFEAGTRFVLVIGGCAQDVKTLINDGTDRMPLYANNFWLSADGAFGDPHFCSDRPMAYLALAEAPSSPVTASDAPGINRAAAEPAEPLTPEQEFLRDLSWFVGDDRKAAALLERARALFSPPPPPAPPERGIGLDVVARDRRWV